MIELGFLSPHLMRDLHHLGDLKVILGGDYEGRADHGEPASRRDLAIGQEANVLLHLEIVFGTLCDMDVRIGLRRSGVEGYVHAINPDLDERLSDGLEQPRSVGAQHEMHAAPFGVADHVEGGAIEKRLAATDEIDPARSHVVEVVDDPLELLERHYAGPGEAE